VFTAAPARPASTPSAPAKAPAPAPAKTPAPAVSPVQPAAKQEKEIPVRPAAPAPAPKPAPAPAPVRPTPAPAPVASAEPAPAARPAPAAKPIQGAAQPVAPRSFLKSPAFFAIVGIFVVVLALGGFFYNKMMKEREADRARQAQIEQSMLAQAKALKEAEQKAADEAKARKVAEEEIARNKSQADSLAKKAEEERRQRELEATNILNGRGSLAIVTDPPGAAIAIKNFAPCVSPTTLKELRLGHYNVDISMPGYDPLSVEVEIKENAVADPGVLKLVRQTGNFEIATEPAGSVFEIRPAAPRITLGASEVKSGKTPATVTDLPTGDYVVTFKRDGWPDHSENVTIEHGKAAHVSWKYVGGSVTITSAPSAARVTRNGQALGETPLTLNDQQPGEVSYTLDLQGFISTTVEGKIEAEKTLALTANLGAEDRIVPLRELDEKPVQIKMVKPVLGYDQERSGGNVLISFVVDRDGTPKDIKVESSSDSEFARRCVEAVMQWRFKPGSIKGVPVKTRVSLPIKL
jgi:TonB family protein